jgi:hypothetical protein
MIPIDFDGARAAHSALKAFFAAHAKGKLDRTELEEIRRLCRAVESAVGDAVPTSSGCGCTTRSRLCAAI